MKSGIFTLDWASVGDALITAVVTAVLVGFYGVVTTHGFDVFSADWGTIGRQMTNLGFVAGVISLGQSLLSDNQGNVLGIPTATQPQEVAG